MVTCGRRYGKTTTARNALLNTAAEYPRRESAYVGKTYRLAFKQYTAFLRNRDMRHLIRRPRLQPVPHIEWRNGHLTWFYSADRPDNLRGDGLMKCIIDEAAYCPQRLVDEILMPSLADNRGELMLMSTFRGQNFYYNWHQSGLKWPNDQDCKSWLYPTSAGIKFQGEEGRTYLDKLKKRYTRAVWLQEFECEASANQNAAFTSDAINKCIGGTALSMPQPGKGYLAAYDTGKAHDPAAIGVMEAETGLLAHAELLPIHMPYPEQIKKAVALAKKFNAPIVVDSTGAGTKDATVDYLRVEGVPVRQIQFRGNVPENMVKQLAYDLETAAMKIPAQYEEVLFQLRHYEFDYRDSGRVTYGAPEGMHDDFVALLLMLRWGIKNHWASRSGAPTNLSAAWQ